MWIAPEGTGEVALAGAGCGDPDLLTRKTLKLMASADLCLIDSLVSGAVRGELPETCRVIEVGKRCGQHSFSQRVISRSLVRYAKLGLRVLRLKGGDSVVFGRLHEEIDALIAGNVVHQVIPGITTASAVAASLGISLTDRDCAQSMTLMTASRLTGEVSDLSRWGAGNQTLGIYMGKRHLKKITDQLIQAGRSSSTPCLVVQNATCADESHYLTPLASLPQVQAQLGEGPAILLIGEVCRRAQVERSAEQVA